MAPKTPDVNPALNPEVAERLGVVKPDTNRTPSSTAAELSSVETETLEFLRERDRGFWKRAGRLAAYAVPFMEGESATAFGDYKMRLREKASDEARDLLDRMNDLSGSMTQRLRWYSLTHAKRLAEVTARVNVAGRTLVALQKEQERHRLDQVSMNRIAAGINQQQRLDHPFMTGVPLVKHLFLTKEKELDALGARESQKLMRAAQEMKSESTQQKRELETKSDARLKGVRQTEEELRTLILRHAPQAVDHLDEQIRACAAGNPSALKTTIDAIDFKGMNAKQKAEVLRLIEKSMDTLSGRSGGMSKAFELAGRTEISGNLNEALMQIRRMPLGTHLLVGGYHGDQTTEMVLESKIPEGYLLFKPVGEKTKVTVDFKQKAAWRMTERSETTEAFKKVNAFAKSIEQAAKAELGLVDPKILRNIYKATQKAAMTKGTNVRLAAIGVVSKYRKDANKNSAFVAKVTEAAKLLPANPVPEDVKAKNPQKPHAQLIDFEKITFAYAA